MVWGDNDKWGVGIEKFGCEGKIEVVVGGDVG